jgi:hypothetical protein
MKPFVSSLLEKRGILAALLLLAAGPVAWANSGAKDDGGSPAVTGTAAATPARPKLNIPIPVKHDAEGVKLPYYDIRGRLQMYFVIQKAIRVDLDHLELKNAYMQTYDEKQAPDATVFMTRSILDLNTRIVTSDIPVTVRRSDFEIVGQKMTFNTAKRSGHMWGHVRMVIYNSQEMASKTPSPSPSPSHPQSIAAPQGSATPRPSAAP